MNMSGKFNTSADCTPDNDTSNVHCIPCDYVLIYFGHCSREKFSIPITGIEITYVKSLFTTFNY